MPGMTDYGNKLVHFDSEKYRRSNAGRALLSQLLHQDGLAFVAPLLDGPLEQKNEQEALLEWLGVDIEAPSRVVHTPCSRPECPVLPARLGSPPYGVHVRCSTPGCCVVHLPWRQTMGKDGVIHG